MNEPRRRHRRSTRKPRRARGFDVTNLFLALAAVLAVLPWLVPMSFDDQPASRHAGLGLLAQEISLATNHGATR
ncbi:MAG: hypothetical protein ABL916_02555 [Burkholderiaceae bacterium]